MRKVLLKNCIYFLAFTMALSSCSKGDTIALEGFNEDPIFMVSATVNGEQEQIVAGLDDYYMFTSFELDSNGVFVFSGSLDKINCEEACPRNTIIFNILDSQLANSPIDDTAQRFDMRKYPFYRHQEIEPGLENLQLSSIFIVWVDENFNTYSSEFLDQSNSSYFEILDSEPFIINEQGHSSIKLSVRFSCDLIGDNGSFLSIKNGLGVFAVAVPE